MFSKEYIKMCEANEDIQILRKFQTGEWYYNKKDKSIELLGDFILVGYVSENTVTKGGYDYDEYKVDWNDFIYLPTQEQLQEMIRDNWICEADMLFAFKYWIEKAMVKQIISIAKYTLTELWLAFIMKEKYNKIWANEKWVEIGSQP